MSIGVRYVVKLTAPRIFLSVKKIASIYAVLKSSYNGAIRFEKENGSVGCGYVHKIVCASRQIFDTKRLQQTS